MISYFCALSHTNTLLFLCRHNISHTSSTQYSPTSPITMMLMVIGNYLYVTLMIQRSSSRKNRISKSFLVINGLVYTTPKTLPTVTPWWQKDYLHQSIINFLERMRLWLGVEGGYSLGIQQWISSTIIQFWGSFLILTMRKWDISVKLQMFSAWLDMKRWNIKEPIWCIWFRQEKTMGAAW